MRSVSVLLFLGLAASAAAVLNVKHAEGEKACVAEDLKYRVAFQNKLAGICEDMCKEVGAYPKCAQCPDFVAPDSTPGVMTWEELLVHMDNLVEWGQETIKGWKSVAAELIQKTAQNQTSCATADMAHRTAVQNKLAGVCEEMCKEVGAYPNCAQCPGFVAPDSTPGVMTWDELLVHMDNLVDWGQGLIKGWKKTASVLQKSQHVTVAVKQEQNQSACVAADLKFRAQFQNKLAGICTDMCKEVGAYPKCAQCPNFVAPDSTPGVVTWDELLAHMDNLVEWGQETIKGWKKTASALQKAMHVTKGGQSQGSCTAEDMTNRAKMQNKLAGICTEMCKEVGAFPKCAQCPNFVAPDSTPGVMTWEELLGHMDNLVEWGEETIKGWKKTASALQQSVTVKAASTACAAEDMKHRIEFQNKLAGICEDMCKEVGAYPKCAQCPDFVAPDSTPGVMTWEELLTHMDNLVEWGNEAIKGWKKTASNLLQK